MNVLSFPINSECHKENTRFRIVLSSVAPQMNNIS